MKLTRAVGVGPERIGLAEGAGGGAMRALICEIFAREAEAIPGGIGLAAMDDGAAIPLGDRWLVVTTDTHVIDPLFFPGGDIGRLAVAGTVNDLAVMGATIPLGLTSAIVIEEGFERATLERIQASMTATCREVPVAIVAGDTKVMGRGELDGLVINTTGVGLTRRLISDAGLRPGHDIVVTGTIGDHGLAVLAKRQDLVLEGALVSDVAPIAGLVEAALDTVGDAITAMKDATRGGVASALHEMADKSKVGIVIEQAALPVSDGVRAASELLGIDPLHVANEGKAIIGVHSTACAALLEALRGHPLGRNAARIGRCTSDQIGRVILDTGFGRRLVTEPHGEPMPRIC